MAAIGILSAVTIMGLSVRFFTHNPEPRVIQTTILSRGWAKYSLPLLVPSQAWEKNNVSEPNVWFMNGKWQMIYTGGWDATRLGYATSTDGIQWVKDPNNPIVGGGAAEWSGNASEASILISQNRLYVYFTPTINHDVFQGGNLLVATGSDAQHLHVLPEPTMHYTKSAQGIVNTCVIQTEKKFMMIFESDVPRSSHWETGVAIATSPTGPFVPQQFPLSSLQYGTGMFGGGMLTKSHGVYTCWYHAAQSGFLPTDIYSATSTDLTHWTRHPMEVTRSLPFEVDQVADPYVVINKDQQYLYYSGMDNSHDGGRIGLAIRRLK